MAGAGQIIASLITGFIALVCFIWIYYHLETFMDSLFGNLLILVVGIICGIIACAQSGLIGGSSQSG